MTMTSKTLIDALKGAGVLIEHPEILQEMLDQHARTSLGGVERRNAYLRRGVRFFWPDAVEPVRQMTLLLAAGFSLADILLVSGFARPDGPLAGYGDDVQ